MARLGVTSFTITKRASSAAEGTTLRGPLDLRAVGVLLLWPIAAVSGFLSLTAWR